MTFEDFNQSCGMKLNVRWADTRYATIPPYMEPLYTLKENAMKRLSIMTFAVTAIVATNATLLVRADNWLWTGATDNIWSTDANWSKDGNNNVNRKFEEASFSEKFKTDYGYRVQFTGNESISWKAHIRTGTEEKPIVFYADDPSHGLKIDKPDGGWYVGYDGCASGEAWLKLESGTYETTGMWQIGYTDTGHLIVGEGATVKCDADFSLHKGSVTVEGGTLTVPSKKWTRFGSHGASTLNLNGGTFATKHIHKDANAPIINFNGGTLQANATDTSNGGLIQSGIAVNVLAGGGKIDNGGFDVTIGAVISGSGRLTFTGAGTTTLNGFQTIGNELVVDEGGVYSPEDMSVGNDSGLTGTLTVNGGTMEESSNKWLRVYNGSAINLNGGIFKTQHIEKFGTATINFNGGTLQATKASDHGLINSSGAVNVNGGVIDSGNFAITIPATLSGTGGLTFIGGNTITLGGSINYSGITGVAPGTTLKANSARVSSILSKGIALVGVPELNTPYTILTSDDDLSSLTLGNVTCPIASAFTADFADESKSIVVTVTALNPGWYVGPADGNLSVAANWSDGVVPTGNAAISCVTKATLTKGASFAPTSITFGAGSASVTINGDTAFENVTEVVSLSSSSHTINVPVRFTGDIQVKQPAMAETGDLQKPHVTFAGGAYAAAGHALESGSSDAVYSRCIFGKYYLASTAANRWNASYQGSTKRRVCVADGSSLYIPYAGSLNELYVGNGAKVDIGDWNTTARGSYQVYGEIVATNLTESGSGDRFMSWDQGTTTPGVFKFESLTNAMTGNWVYLCDNNAVSKHVYYIGAGGMNFSGTTATYCIGLYVSGNHETIRPWYSDFTIARRGDGGRALVFRQTVEFCTDDESGAGRTITIDTVTRGDTSPSVIVSGSGTLKVNWPASNDQHPPVTVTDTATLEYASGAKLGDGTVTLGAGTTFAFANSGSTLSLPSTIVLPDSGVATLRIGGDRLKSGDHTILASAPEGAAAHLAIDQNSLAIDGRKYSLTEKEGALVLNIVPIPGLKLIIR